MDFVNYLVFGGCQVCRVLYPCSDQWHHLLWLMLNFLATQCLESHLSSFSPKLSLAYSQIITRKRKGLSSWTIDSLFGARQHTEQEISIYVSASWRFGPLHGEHLEPVKTIDAIELHIMGVVDSCIAHL